MNRRYCARRTHCGRSRAWRMILARHTDDDDAHQHVVDEIGDCWRCCRDVAVGAVSAADVLLIGRNRIPRNGCAGSSTLPCSPKGWTAETTPGAAE